jgi:hypothetical protein
MTVNDFKILSPGYFVIKPFYLLLLLQTSKLECLSLANFSSFVYYLWLSTTLRVEHFESQVGSRLDCKGTNTLA